LNGEPYDQVKERLAKVFGIQSFSPAIRTEKDLDQIKAAALHIVKQAHIPGGTFKISARRSDKSFEYDTQQLNYEIGSHILINVEDITVDVKKPDINVIVE
ncbi:THUMP domain-containing protein, partial [Staphylococcus epidermidis]